MPEYLFLTLLVSAVHLGFPNDSSQPKAKISDVLAANIDLMNHQRKEEWS